MATLQKIRKQSILLLIVVGLAMFAFIIGDFLTSGSSLFQQSQENIVHINGDKLNYREYEARIQEMEDVYKLQTGQSSLSEEIVNQIRESVYETIVRERLLDEQASALGVTVTDKELFDMVNGENPHYIVQQMPFFQNPETGQFDRAQMMNFLRTIQLDDLSMYSADAQAQIQQMKNYWLFWENNLKYARLDEKINNLLDKSVASNTIEAQAAFDARQRSVDFAYAFKPYSSLPDSAFKVSKAEAKKLYEEKIEQFRQEPYRAARYVVVDVLPTQDDNDAVKAQIDRLAENFATTADYEALVNAHSEIPFENCYIANTAYAGVVRDFAETSAVGAVQGPLFDNNVWMMLRKIDEVTLPDSVKVSQIFIRNTGEEGEHLRDSLMNELVRHRADFEQLARDYSEDQTAANGGDMGWFREMDALRGMGADFVNACFSAKKNQYYSVKSNFGLHIIKVTDTTKPVKKSKLAQLAMSVTPTSKTFSVEYNKLNQLVAKNQNLDDFVKAAQEAGYFVQSAPNIRQSDNAIGNVSSMRQAVRFVYNNKVGAVSTVFENSNNQYVVVAVSEINDGEYRSFESVQDQLVREIVNQKKAAAILKDFKSAETLAQVAAQNGMRTDTARLVTFSTRRMVGIGDEPALLSAVTAAPLNELSAPLQCKNGIYVYEVLSQVNAENDFNATDEQNALDADKSYRIMYQAYSAVRDQADIKDSRIRFY